MAYLAWGWKEDYKILDFELLLQINVNLKLVQLRDLRVTSKKYGVFKRICWLTSFIIATKREEKLLKLIEHKEEKRLKLIKQEAAEDRCSQLQK